MPVHAASPSTGLQTFDLTTQVLKELGTLHDNTRQLLSGIETAAPARLEEVLAHLKAANCSLSGQSPMIESVDQLQMKAHEILTRAEAFKAAHIVSVKDGAITLKLGESSLEAFITEGIYIARALGIPEADTYKLLISAQSESSGSYQIPQGSTFEVCGLCEDTRGCRKQAQQKIFQEQGLLLPKMKVLGAAHLAYAIATAQRNTDPDSDATVVVGAAHLAYVVAPTRLDLFRGDIVKFDTGLANLSKERGFNITGGIQRGFEEAPAASLKILTA